MNERLKNIIFYKLYYDLKHVEVIPYKENFWFIDREQKCWYFVYDKNNKHLWWYYHYFRDYFNYFSLERSDAEYVMSRWVEEVLFSTVDTTEGVHRRGCAGVEEVLFSMIDTTNANAERGGEAVEEVLFSTVDTTEFGPVAAKDLVEKVLKSTSHE